MSLRILGAVMLGCSCALTGFLHEYRQRRRLQSIKQWRDALELLRTELSYRRPPVAELLRAAAERAEGAPAEILRQMEVSLRQTGNWPETAALLPALMSDPRWKPAGDALRMLGSLPADAQLRLLERSIAELTAAADEAERCIRARAPVWRASGVYAGLLLVCLLW